MPAFALVDLVTAFLLLAALPVLAGAITMAADRPHFGPRCFNPAGAATRSCFSISSGSSPPEVYIMILPAFGMVFPADRLDLFEKARCWYLGMAYGDGRDRRIGFVVWAHHMSPPASMSIPPPISRGDDE